MSWEPFLIICWHNLTCMHALWMTNNASKAAENHMAKLNQLRLHMPDCRNYLSIFGVFENMSVNGKHSKWKFAFKCNCINWDIASDGFWTDTHTVSSTSTGWLQSDLGACGDDLRNIYLYLDCFQFELNDVTEKTVAFSH